MTSHNHDAAIEESFLKAEKAIYRKAWKICFHRYVSLMQILGYRHGEALKAAIQDTSSNDEDATMQDHWRVANAACERLVGVRIIIYEKETTGNS